MITVGTQMAPFGFLDVYTKEFAGCSTTARKNAMIHYGANEGLLVLS